MVNLLESMHKCCLPSGVPSESPSAYEKSLVHKIFGGRLRSQVTYSLYLVEYFDIFVSEQPFVFRYVANNLGNISTLICSQCFLISSSG
jgi:hypothetical protein